MNPRIVVLGLIIATTLLVPVAGQESRPKVAETTWSDWMRQRRTELERGKFDIVIQGVHKRLARRTRNGSEASEAIGLSPRPDGCQASLEMVGKLGPE